MTKNTFGKVCDFLLRVVMLFTTLIALIFFAGYYPEHSFIFGFLALLFVLTMASKGIYDIFRKE